MFLYMKISKCVSVLCTLEWGYVHAFGFLVSLCKYVHLFLIHSVCTLFQAQWSGKQLREAAMELQDSAQTEAQRRAAQHSRLALILPPLVLHILTLGQLFGKLVGVNESTKEIIVMTCSALIFIAFQRRVVSCQCLTAH